jgi:hypothetical protein
MKPTAHYIVRVLPDLNADVHQQRAACEALVAQLRANNLNAHLVSVRNRVDRHPGLAAIITANHALSILRERPCTIDELRLALADDGLRYSRAHLTQLVRSLRTSALITRRWRSGAYEYAITAAGERAERAARAA